ncbi:MAG: DNA polymerase/3'-5' exonuclease PolX [Candidatus Binatia bacterium]
MSSRAVTNAEVAERLREMAAFLDMTAVQFKPRAYEKASYAVEGLDHPIRELYQASGVKALAALPSIGKGIAERIGEIIETGTCADLEALRRATPVDVMGLTAIEGLGPKMVKALYDDLGIRTVAELQRAAQAGRIRTLPRFGEKTEAKILKGIGFLAQRSGRQPLGAVLELARDIEARLAGLRGVQRAAMAGSVRRRRETVGDLDFLVVARTPQTVMEFFVAMPEVVQVHGSGPTKTMVQLRNGMDADLRVVPAASFGAALNYFTGSKDHNVSLRRIAIEHGWKLNEYGVFDGEQQIAGRTEAEVYKVLGLAYVPPELREDTGEIELARRGRLPRLIEPGTLRGDVQIQTDWTDGADSLEDMVAAGKARGLEYMAITDHTKSLAMMGADEATLREQGRAIAALNRKQPGLRVLSGAEVNINRDGTLDIDDAVLAELEVVGVAVHSHFNLSREDQTARLIRPMESPHADILFHPTGRVMGKREPYDIDIDAVIAAAKRTGTVLEIDALPDRMDLKDEHVRKAVDAGVKLVIDSDAHALAHLGYPDDYGISIARRGWATGKDVLNTLPVEKFLAGLKGGRKRRKP